MEPMHPELREALKVAHPNLTDEMIDQYEALLAQRFRLNPETQEAEIRALDARREQFVVQHLPHVRQVTQLFNQQKALRERTRLP
jgi:hypothetical protein